MKAFWPVIGGAVLLWSCASAPEMGAGAATSAGAIRVPSAVPYRADAASDAVRKDCSFDRDLSRQIAESAAEEGVPVQLVDKVSPSAEGRTLQLETVQMYAMGGGSWTGRKFAHVHGELRENGRIVGDFHMKRATGMSFTGCGALETLSEALGEDIVAWLKNPRVGTRIGMPPIN